MYFLFLFVSFSFTFPPSMTVRVCALISPRAGTTYLFLACAEWSMQGDSLKGISLMKFLSAIAFVFIILLEFISRSNTERCYYFPLSWHAATKWTHFIIFPSVWELIPNGREVGECFCFSSCTITMTLGIIIVVFLWFYGKLIYLALHLQFIHLLFPFCIHDDVHILYWCNREMNWILCCIVANTSYANCSYNFFV